MNLIEGEARDGRFAAGAPTFDLSEHLANAQGQGVFGLRPESTRMGSLNSNRGVRFRLGGVEHLGGERVYHLEAGGYWIKALWRRSSSQQ